MHPIERYRRGKGWTQEDLAKAVTVSINTVQGWENKGARPRPKALLQLATALGIPALRLDDEITIWQNGGKMEPKPKRAKTAKAVSGTKRED